MRGKPEKIEDFALLGHGVAVDAFFGYFLYS